jgi:hypothetical protein
MMLEYAVEPVDVQDTESFGLPYDHTTEMASINSPDNRFQIRAGRQVWQWGSTIFGGVSFTFPKVVGDLSMKVAVEGLWNLESEFAVYPPAVFGTIDLFYEPAEDLGVYASVGGNFKEYNKPSVWFTTPYWSGVDDSHDVEIVATETQKRLNALQRMDTIEPIYSDGDIAYSATSYDSCLSLGHDGCDGSALVFGDEYWTCTDLGNGTMECARPLWDSDAEGNSYSFATEHVIVEDTGTDVFDVVTQGQAHKLEMGKVWFEFTDPVLKLLDSSKTYGEFAEGLQGMTFEEKLSALNFAAYLLNTTYNLTGTVKTIKKVDRIGQEDLYKTIRSAAFDEITEKTSVCRGFAKFITRLASDIGLSATAAILSTTSEAHVISLVSEGDGEPFHVVNFGKYDVSINALTVTDAIWNYIYAVNSDLNVNEVEGHGMYTEPIIVNLYDSNGRYGGRVEFPLKNLIDKEIGVDAGAAEFINGGN